MAKRKKSRKKITKKADLDLNNDGKLDKKDKKIAAKALATDFEKKEKAEKKNGQVAEKDINKTYRKGDFVPQSQIDQWDKMGIDWKVWF